VAVCGVKCIDLTTETIKILGIHYSYNKKIQLERNFLRAIVKMENVLKLWRLRNLTLEGKINVFKSLAFSKIIHLALVTSISSDIIEHLNKIQKNFLWKNKTPKIKHETLRKNYEQGGLKSVNIFSKIVSLQCSWVQKLFDKNFHEWKVIPLYLIELNLGKHFRFHSNLLIKSSILQNFPSYYQEMINNWSKYLSSDVSVTSTIMSQFLWYNKYILIDKRSFNISDMSDKGLNYVGQLFTAEGKIKSWEIVKLEFNLDKKLYFSWMQLIESIPNTWKKNILDDNGSSKNLCIYDSHLIRKSQVYVINRLNSKELYSIQNFCNNSKTTSQKYFESLFQTTLDWKEICLLPRKVTIDTFTRSFQYKIINNVLYLNKMLFVFKKVISPLCSFCKSEDETPLHLFFECTLTQNLWKQLSSFSRQRLNIPTLTPQSAIFGFYEPQNKNEILINHLLLIFLVKISPNFYKTI